MQAEKKAAKEAKKLKNRVAPTGGDLGRPFSSEVTPLGEERPRSPRTGGSVELRSTPMEKFERSFLEERGTSMVSRYVEKKPGFDGEARALAAELRDIVGISGLTGVRLVNRYDVEGASEELFAACVPTVFSEPQSDTATYDRPMPPARRCSRWSSCPVSSTSGPTPQASASSSSARASARAFLGEGLLPRGRSDG